MYRHKKKLMLLAISMVGILSFGFGQNVTISGTITSAEDKQTLPGVIVQVTGTNTGVQTDLDGRYTIHVPPESKSLSFTFTGFVTQKIPIGSNTSIDVVMIVDKKLLDEVVVVGYGVQSKKDVTGAISTIKGEAIKDLPVQSFDQALAGKASGVNITLPNGVLNNPPVIRVRGFNSITSSSYPLIVVDGIPVFTGDQSSNAAANNPLGDINPADIESIDILKDASATAIYGSRAANGVLIITTKKGKEGKPKINYSSWIGITQAFNLPKVLNAEQYMLIKNEARRNANLPEAFFPSYNPDGSLVDTRWYDYIYRTGVAHNNSLSISGATPVTSYYFSLGYTKQDGFVKKNEFDRTSVRFNIEQKITNHIKGGANVNYTKNFNQAPATGSLPGEGFQTAGAGRLAFMTAPNISPYTSDGWYNITSDNTIGTGANTVASGSYNPVAIMNLNKFTSESNHLMATVFGEVQILKGLTFKSSYSIDNNDIDGSSFLSNKHGDGFNLNGVATNVRASLKKSDWTNTLFYQKTFNEKHSISLLAGTEELFSTVNQWGGSRQNIADDFFINYQGNYLTTNPPTGLNVQAQNVFLSYFGRATYDYSKKYFFTVSLRRDGFSGLSKGNKFGNFGGASFGWSLSEEKFYKNSVVSKAINSLKLRTSYGKVGNMGIPNYGSLNLYSSDLYADVNTIVFTQAGNSTLKWETSSKFDVGATMGFLKERLQFEISYFNNNISGLILNAPQAPSKGIPGNSLLQNIGSMYNKGIEFSFTSTNIDKKNFLWSSNINYSYIKNEVTALAAGNADIVGTTSSLEKTNITRVGYSVGSLYAVKTAGVNPENGRRIFINKNGEKVQYNHVVAAGQSKWTYMDGSPAPAISGEDAVIMGNAIPKFFGGFNNTFTYKNMLDLNIGITFSGGNYIYNGSKAGMRDQRFWNNSEDVMDRWTFTGQNTDIPRVVFGDNISNGSAFAISENVERGDFIKFKSISLGYKFGSKFLTKTKIASLRVYVQVTNLYTLTKYTGSDPEISVNGNSNLTPGVDRNSVPQSRTFTFGLNLDL
jgi:TonB-linked SusC/RagA family outer membrane protein